MSNLLFDPVKTQSRITREVIVAFSGGKESAATLDMCSRYFDRVAAFFLYICPNLSFQERQLEWYESRYGVDIIRLPHPMCSEFMRYGVFRDFDPNVPIIGINDVYSHVRRLTGMQWVAAGERIDDSIVRRAMIKHSGTVDAKRGRFYPVANWSKADIMRYIKLHNLRQGNDSRVLGFSFRGLEGRQLWAIKKHFPEDYEKLKALYPFCEGAVVRYERYGK